MSIGQLCDAIPGQPFCEVRYATVDGGTPFVFSTPFAQEAVEVRAHDVVDRDPNAVSFDLQPELDAIVGEKVHVLAERAQRGWIEVLDRARTRTILGTLPCWT